MRQHGEWALEREKVMINIQRYGNTTNGTIPMCFMNGKIS